MRQNDVQIGGEYRVRIGDRLAPVTVLRRLDGRGRSRFLCRTGDTGREIKATAARLRPMTGTAAAAVVQARRVESSGPRPFDGATGDRRRPAAPVAGVIVRLRGSSVLALSKPNAALVDRAVDACHVAERFAFVARQVRRRVGACVIWNTIPRALRRGILFHAAERHAANRTMFAAVAGHDPLPSERMVAEAVGLACGLGAMPR